MMTYERPCLFCNEPAESLSMYCSRHREEQKNARTENRRINEFIDKQYHEFLAPPRGWPQRVREGFVVVEQFDEQDGSRLPTARAGTQSRRSQTVDDPRYEAEVGWFTPHMPHDVYVQDTGVTLEQMRDHGAV